jgi:hypothetical protein
MGNKNITNDSLFYDGCYYALLDVSSQASSVPPILQPSHEAMARHGGLTCRLFLPPGSITHKGARPRLSGRQAQHLSSVRNAG